MGSLQRGNLTSTSRRGWGGGGGGPQLDFQLILRG